MYRMIKANDREGEILFDPHDWNGMRELCKRFNEFKVPCIGKNDEGESVWISINRDNITTKTFQRNGWIRTNIYWIEDFIVEETYDK